MATKGATSAPHVDGLVTNVLTAVFAVLLAAYNPLGMAWPAMRSVNLLVYAGVMLLSVSTGSSVIHDRLLHAPRNWARHPLRSATEWAFWLTTVHAVQRAVLSTPSGALVATLLACVVCYAGDEATRLIERCRLVRSAKTFDPAPEFFASGARIAPADARSVTMDEVRAHNKRDDCWIVVDGAVLDVTTWADAHPGGPLIITSLGGRDATDQYKAFHGTSMGARLRAMCVGSLEASPETTPSPAQVAFRQLHEDLRARGEFSYPLSRTVRPMVLPWVLMAAAMVCIAAAGSSAAPTAVAAAGGALAGLAWQQMSLFGHDIGHGNVTGYFADDHLIGVFLMPFFGIGISWWKATHNTHHVVTNSETHDPDIQHMPVFAVSPRMLSGFYSYYHDKVFKFDQIARTLLARQHLLYYPIMAVAKVNLYVQTHIWLFLNAAATSTLETVAMLLHYAAIGAALAALPTWPARAAFFFASLAVAGLLHVQITLSHFPMETHEGVAYTSGERSWWHMQLAGTMDVDCAPSMDWFHGGLQYQTIHHLFPRLPRFALRKVAAEVAATCDKVGLRYHRTTFTAAQFIVMDTLHKTAVKCADAKMGSDVQAPLLWDALNARG